jgi:hypothetical protein
MPSALGLKIFGGPKKGRKIAILTRFSPPNWPIVTRFLNRQKIGNIVFEP